MRAVILTLLLSATFLQQLSAQFPDYHFRYYDVTSGLPSNEVICMSQDAQGFIWIGTNNGISTFNGISFAPALAGPPAVAIRYILKDKKDKLWIAGDFNGAGTYDPVSARYTHFTHREQDSASIGDIASYRMVEDNAGNIWFGHYFKGVSVYNRQTGKFKRYRKDNSRLGSNLILSIYTDASSNIWICTADAGIWMFDKRSGDFIPAACNSKLPSRLANGIIQDRSYYYWIVSDKGIARVAFNGDIVKLFDNTTEGFGNDYFYNIYMGPDGFIYACSPKGLYVINPDTYQFKIYKPFKEEKDGRESFKNRCTNAFFDRLGDLWIQFNEGFCYASVKGNILYPAQYTDPVFSADRYNHFEYIRDNVLWNINRLGFVRKNLLSGTVKTYPLPAALLKAVKLNGARFSSCTGRFISVYIPGTGICYLDTLSGKNFVLPPVAGGKIFTTDNSGNTACDSRDNFWGLDNQLGLVKYDYATQQWQLIDPQNKKPKYTLFYYCTRFTEDKKGNMWIANPYYTLLKYNLSNNSYKTYKPVEGDPFSLSMALPQTVYCDTRGIIWVAGIGGVLDVYDEKKDRFVHLNTGNVFNKLISQLTEDSKHNIWCFSSLGLTRLAVTDIDFNKIYNSNFTYAEYGNRNGINGYYFGNNIIIHHPDGRMIFDTKDGICAIYPDQLGLNKLIPDVYITGISINGEAYQPENTRSVTYLDTLHLDHSQNNITFSFAALNYLYPESNTYSYRLEGIESSWTFTNSPNLVATYSNLAPGTYRFIVKAGNNDAHWNEKGRSIWLVIKPAYWQTWWFRTGIAVLVLAGLYILYRFRIRQVLKLQQVRNRISRDLHDDIGATVSSVNISAKLLQDNLGKPEKAKDLIGKIRQDVQTVGESLDDIVWSVNPKNDNWEQVAVRMRRYWSDLLEHKDIANRFTFPDTANLRQAIRSEMRKELFLIFKEATNNIAKHSEATQAWCTVEISDNAFKMTISDNGKGFNTASLTERNGLRNMQARSEAIKGRLQVESQAGEGTTVILVVNSY